MKTQNPLEGLESSQCLEVMVGFGLEENRINGMLEFFIILFYGNHTNFNGC